MGSEIVDTDLNGPKEILIYMNCCNKILEIIMLDLSTKYCVFIRFIINVGIT